MPDKSDADNEEIKRTQPLGTVNPKLLIGLAAVVVLIGIIVLIITLTKT